MTARKCMLRCASTREIPLSTPNYPRKQSLLQTCMAVELCCIAGVQVSSVGAPAYVALHFIGSRAPILLFRARSASFASSQSEECHPMRETHVDQPTLVNHAPAGSCRVWAVVMTTSGRVKFTEWCIRNLRSRPTSMLRGRHESIAMQGPQEDVREAGRI